MPRCLMLQTPNTQQSLGDKYEAQTQLTNAGGEEKEENEKTKLTHWPMPDEWHRNDKVINKHLLIDINFYSFV